MAGKGSKLRPGANLQVYRDNYDKIFSKKPVDKTKSSDTYKVKHKK